MPAQRAAKSLEELALLRAVCADLSDGVALSVYCDWPEEHGDDSGPFLRRFLRALVAGKRLPAIPAAFSQAWAEVLALPARRRLRGGLDAKDRGMRAHLRKEYPQGFKAYEPHFNDLLKSLHPGVRLLVGDAAPMEAYPIGTSRAVGLPDLPRGMSWPHREAGPNCPPWPMMFLLQIDLADARGTFADGKLPDAGVLSLFQSPECLERDRRLFYFPPGTALHRHPAPELYVWPPGYDVEIPSDTARPLTLADSMRYDRTPEGMGDHEPDPEYLLEGYYDQQADEHWFCEPWREAINAHWGDYFEVPTTHLKLFELRSVEELLWHFCDGDRYHVFVAPEDARAGRFEGVICGEV